MRDKNEANFQVLAVSCGQTLAPPSTLPHFMTSLHVLHSDSMLFIDPFFGMGLFLILV